ncbi:MAG: glycosyltransferase family 8 protein [Ginsengibacter sp.]
MKQAFVTFLATENFLPGVLTLNRSLKRFGNTNYPLVVIVSEIISERSVKTLKECGLTVKIVKEIQSPYLIKKDYRNFGSTFTKLRIFELCEYDKIVYLDADMLVCDNIELLFQKLHMSAVIAGGILPSNKMWEDLNSGLLVIEPSRDLFNKIFVALKFLPSKDGSDQGFLHQFFPNWKCKPNLHLEHKYNVPSWYLDEYCSTLDFKFNFMNGALSTKNISIIHFWGLPKPWQISERQKDELTKKEQAELLWRNIYEETRAS